MEVNADLHIHGPYSGGTSARLTLNDIARGAKAKGIDVIGTGDCLHPHWRKEIKALQMVDEGTYELNGIRLLLSVEVEDSRRVHHLLIFPSMSKVEEFYESVRGKSRDIDRDGRPHLFMDGEDIATPAHDAGALIGPCHAFTPWTSLYAYHPSLTSCYGDMAFNVDFLELGLSANSDYADRIAELQNITFLTNSDAHSSAVYRLAREFNRFKVQDITFDEIAMAIRREKGRKIVLNIGLPPEEGKYNRTACTRCYRQYSISDAVRMKWRCPCGGRIKKGVRDRVDELATWEKPRHPEHRPPYIEIIPLSEIIARAIGVKSPDAKAVQAQWKKLVEAHGSEVKVLVDTPMEDMPEGVDPRVIEAIKAFREGKIRIIPGGGGKYGRILMPWEENEGGDTEPSKGAQKSLFDFQ